jgi:methionine--tRNA ligase beta chain
MITFEDFQKLEIKIGIVVSVEKVEGADKLLKFIFDLGDEKRQILAGMAPFFDNLEELVGKQMPILVNIEPRKFMGQESQGMILAADDQGSPILLHPAKKIPAGSIVK